MHNPEVNDVRQKITELAQLMDEFHLVEAKWSGPDWKVGFSRIAEHDDSVAGEPIALAASPRPVRPTPQPEPERPVGFPISSPMQGIFYLTSNPGSPAFVREGQSVEAGQVVGLIEAMKVFNELTSPSSGTVLKVAKQNGDLVQPGEPIMFIG